MRCGFSKINITPNERVELAGYGPDLHRLFDSVHDELWVRALVLETEAGTTLFLELDVTEMGQEIVQDAIAEIRSKLDESIVQHIICAPIHTHNAPAVIVSNAWGEFSKDYSRFVSTQMAKVAVAAVNNLTSCTLEFAETRIPEVGFNRAHQNQPWDDRVSVVRFNRSDDKPVVLFSAAVHPVTIDQRGNLGQAISADWPGVTNARLEQDLGVDALFVMGTSGDIDPVLAWHMLDFEGARLIGVLIAERIMKALGDATPVYGQERIGVSSVSLPLQWPMEAAQLQAFVDREMEKKSDNRAVWQKFYATWVNQLQEWDRREIQCSVHVIAFGDSLAIISVQGEVFSSIGEWIRRESPVRNIIFNTIVNESIGYIPDEDDFAEHGYASYLSPCIMGYPLYKENVGRVLQEGVRHLFHELVEDE